MENADRNNFWRICKAAFSNNKPDRAVTVNGLSENVDIANALADKYKLACMPNSTESDALFYTEYTC